MRNPTLSVKVVACLLELELALPPATSFSCPELLIGRVVFINWPTLQRARVTRIEDRRCVTELKANATTDPTLHAQTCQEQHVTKQTLASEEWTAKVDGIRQTLKEKKGVEAGLIDVLVTVKRIDGILRQGLDRFIERYGAEEIYPLQAVMLENVYPRHGMEFAGEQELHLAPHDRLLYVGEDYPGTVATIVDAEDDSAIPRGIKTGEMAILRAVLGDVDLSKDESLIVSLQGMDPRARSALRSVQKELREYREAYYPSGAVATHLKVTPQGLSRITGSLWVNTGTERQEIGLAVKLGSKNMCVVGYVRPSSNGTGWEYTESLIQILESYRDAFYWVFEAVDATPEGGEINLTQVFPHKSDVDLNEMVKRTKAWLRELPLTGRPLVTAEATVGSIAVIQRAQTALSATAVSPKPLLTRLPRSQLIPPSDASPILSNEVGGDMCIGDFVVYIGSSLVGFGSPGVVIGTLMEQVEVLFGSKVMHTVSILGNSTEQCSCLVSTLDLVNISRLTGEDRTLAEAHGNKPQLPSHRPKHGSMCRSYGGRRRSRSSWNSRGSHILHEILPPHAPPLPDCAMRPVMAVPAYGSGVYIPGMTPMPGVPVSVPPHPMIPYVNYSLTPRYG